MMLKTKISLLIATLFTFMFGAAVIVIYVSFANFRKEEFEGRLKEKAYASIRLLTGVKHMNKELLKLFDEINLNKMYDEKTLIFDSNYKLIYSSINDSKINWKISDLEYLKKYGTFFKKEGYQEVYGVYYDTTTKDYYALISASDEYGNRKLNYLLLVLLSTYIVFTVITWITVFYYVKKMLHPLSVFHFQIKGINEKNMDTRIKVENNNNEIGLLASEFNRMLQRIDESYQQQREFTSHASHELRTPLARITAQIENKLFDPSTDAELAAFLKKIVSNTNQLSDLISSLLLLSKLENSKFDTELPLRIDELLFESSTALKKSYPEFKLLLNIESAEEMDELLEIRGNKSLLEIALLNLLKNACIYSEDKQAKVDIRNKEGHLVLSIMNNGTTLKEEEQKKIFQPFIRGKNSTNKSGIGLGLRVVQSILNQHNATISYQVLNNSMNCFSIQF